MLFERVPPGAAFAASWNAFAQNLLPLLAYAAASLVLLAFGAVTLGLGFVLALPLWVASSYAAWKDIFGVRDAPEPEQPRVAALQRRPMREFGERGIGCRVGRNVDGSSPVPRADRGGTTR